MYDVIFSIDIGLHGGIAMFDPSEASHESHGLLRLKEMPTIKLDKGGDKKKNVLDLDALLHILEAPKFHDDKNILVIFEDIHAFPGQGSVSTGTLMEQKGIIRGMVKALGYEELPIQPKTWQKFFNMIPPKELKGKSAQQTKTLRKKWLKSKSLEFARDYFGYPDLVIDTDGKSDALLIGKWYLEKEPQ